MTAVVDRLSRCVDAVFDRLERRFTFRSALAALFLLNLEAALLATYVLVGNHQVYDWFPMLFPFVWINVAIAAVAWTSVEPATRRQRAVAVAVAAAYLVVLGYAGGWIGLGNPEIPTNVELVLARIPPGWAPALLANTPALRVSIVFYQFVGYLALAYLLYATVIDAAGSAIGGVLGLLSCVSCTWPVLGSIVTSVFGSGTSVVAVTMDWPYVLSTAIFVLTVVLLYYRPGFDRLPGRKAA